MDPDDGAAAPGVAQRRGTAQVHVARAASLGVVWAQAIAPRRTSRKASGGVIFPPQRPPKAPENKRTFFLDTGLPPQYCPGSTPAGPLPQGMLSLGGFFFSMFCACAEDLAARRGDSRQWKGAGYGG